MCTSWDYLCEIVFKTTQDDQPEPAVLAGMEQPSSSSDGCEEAEACHQVTVPPCQCAFGFAEQGHLSDMRQTRATRQPLPPGSDCSRALPLAASSRALLGQCRRQCPSGSWLGLPFLPGLAGSRGVADPRPAPRDPERLGPPGPARKIVGFQARLGHFYRIGIF